MRVVITGAGGMLGSSLVRAWFDARPDDVVIPIQRSDADLRDRAATMEALRSAAPDVILHAAAKVGGISANMAAPTQFLADNIAIDSNVIDSARALGVRDFVYFGSSCMYPRDYRQPLVETDILAAPLEPTNEGYALAKITASKLCEYISRQYRLSYKVIIPSNLYGPNDHYGSVASHLVAAAIYKSHVAKMTGADYIEVWGDGTARREFTNVQEVAGWVAGAIDEIASWPAVMNLGLGKDYSIREFYEFALAALGYEAELRMDPSKPAGMRQKLMDSSLARKFGWNPSIDVPEGMRDAYATWLSASKESK